MSADFEIRAEWEKLERGAPEERACFAAIGIRYHRVWLTEAEDAFVGRVRAQVHLSAYRLAEWLAWNWWRLRWEPRSRALDWALAHHMGTIGGGYIWPNVTVFSDGERIALLAKPTKSDENEPLRYITDIAAVFLASVFESGVDLFIEQVLGQLTEENILTSNLSEIWSNVREERADVDFAMRRKLEALLGFDPDEADDTAIETLIRDAQSMGQRAMEEVAAEPTRGGTVITASRLREAAVQRGFDLAPRDTVRFAPGTPLPTVGQVPAWLRGTAAARELRRQQNLGENPIGNARLVQMAAVNENALNPESASFPLFSFALDHNTARGSVVLRSKWKAGRRFELARVMGDRIAGNQDGLLLPATNSQTYRQKFQRAFAAELLCPFEALEDLLQDDYSAETIQDAAEHFEVSPLTVRTLLVNHGRLAREDLEEDLDPLPIYA